jgi:hypothetical protein
MCYVVGSGVRRLHKDHEIPSRRLFRTHTRVDKLHAFNLQVLHVADRRLNIANL